MIEPTFVRIRNIAVDWFHYRIIIEAWHEETFIGAIMFKGEFPYSPEVKTFCENILFEYDLELTGTVDPSFRKDDTVWSGHRVNKRIYGLSVAEYNALPEASRQFLALGAL